ncbi:M56 family metallopeptidase [Paenibacillus whitsoniae]|uniref:M56 family peptidase n=1 Tax=Paenibacillus whitsoniae TaxID=2496558 RepID=A0A430JKQ4_9BACL|nr:M56 family metallopeptidase [Paenibacillus whitsoniae]RTE11608.1 M56 family peptidase [Paenibacillus whitsoniae]
MTESRFKWLYAAVLAAFGLVLWQMLQFVIGHLFHLRPMPNLFDLCFVLFTYLHLPAPFAMRFVGVLIAVTWGTLAWLSAQHAWAAVKAGRFIRKLHASEQTRSIAARSGLRPEQLRIIRHASPLAMTVGLWRPRIVLSTGLIAMLEESELRAVIEHEKCHVRYRDPLGIFLLTMMSKAMGYIPMFTWMSHKYPIMIELRADKFAIGQMAQSADLGSALLKMLREKTTLHMAMSHASFAESSMNLRIRHILDPELPLDVRWPIARLALSVAALVLLQGLI